MIYKINRIGSSDWHLCVDHEDGSKDTPLQHYNSKGAALMTARVLAGRSARIMVNTAGHGDV